MALAQQDDNAPTPSCNVCGGSKRRAKRYLYGLVMVEGGFRALKDRHGAIGVRICAPCLSTIQGAGLMEDEDG